LMTSNCNWACVVYLLGPSGGDGLAAGEFVLPGHRPGFPDDPWAEIKVGNTVTLNNGLATAVFTVTSFVAPNSDFLGQLDLDVEVTGLGIPEAKRISQSVVMSFVPVAVHIPSGDDVFEVKYYIGPIHESENAPYRLECRRTADTINLQVFVPGTAEAIAAGNFVLPGGTVDQSVPWLPFEVKYTLEIPVPGSYSILYAQVVGQAQLSVVWGMDLRPHTQ
jgi:hypothetical protein